MRSAETTPSLNDHDLLVEVLAVFLELVTNVELVAGFAAGILELAAVVFFSHDARLGAIQGFFLKESPAARKVSGGEGASAIGQWGSPLGGDPGPERAVLGKEGCIGGGYRNIRVEISRGVFSDLNGDFPGARPVGVAT
ncbi:hypothetical protein N8077_05190 [Myxococcota bacterium]|nr:hypothetical protein [Myxococcota bacterium]